MLPSRPLTRAYFRAAVVGKTFGHRALVNGPASSLGPKVPSSKGTGPILLWAVDDRAAPASTASAPAAGASSGVASSKAPSAQPGALAGKDGGVGPGEYEVSPRSIERGDVSSLVMRNAVERAELAAVKLGAAAERAEAALAAREALGRLALHVPPHSRATSFKRSLGEGQAAVDVAVAAADAAAAATITARGEAATLRAEAARGSDAVQGMRAVTAAAAAEARSDERAKATADPKALTAGDLVSHHPPQQGERERALRWETWERERELRAAAEERMVECGTLRPTV